MRRLLKSYKASAFVNAAAINDVNKLTSSTSTVSAQSIMAAEYPKLAAATLATTSGPTIYDTLKVLQTKYGVTADLVDRALTFAEVKAQIDAGNIVQRDGYDTSSTAAQGSPDNIGHCVAIVGYIMPTSGTGTPYYQIWNPWWNQIVYVSSASPSITLGGVKYNWTRSWTNWRKVATTAPVVKNATTQQKATSAGFTREIFRKNEKKDILGQLHLGRKKLPLENALFSTKQRVDFWEDLNFKKSLSEIHVSLNNGLVPEMGSETSILDFRTKINWGYCKSLDGKEMEAFANTSMQRGSVGANNGVAFIQGVDQLITDTKILKDAGSFAFINAMFSLAIFSYSKGNWAASTAFFGAAETIGKMVGIQDISSVASTVFDYIQNSQKVEKSFAGGIIN